MREEMQAQFLEAVQRSGSPFVLISGDREERFEKARAAIDDLLNAG
jgi:nicotinamide riboside kinase